MPRTSRQIALAARRAQDDRLAKIRAIVCEIVKIGKCPQCGRQLRRNLALSGWWQCSQFGAEGFRADSSLPSCDWQGFTE